MWKKSDMHPYIYIFKRFDIKIYIFTINDKKIRYALYIFIGNLEYSDMAIYKNFDKIDNKFL